MENNSEIRPLTIDVPQADLDDLRDRLARSAPVGLERWSWTALAESLLSQLT